MLKITKDMRKTFSEIYAPENIENQVKRYTKAAEIFISKFGEGGDLSFYSSPGRVEIGGNHTDHQGGKVIAVSVDMDIIAAVEKNEGFINIISEGYDEIINVNLNDIAKREEDRGKPAALVKGVLNYLRDKGYNTGGFKAYVSSNVLSGSGLSSSAAFESLIGGVINEEFNRGLIPKAEIAKAGKFAENIYFGKMCGLMDQMAASVGGFIYIDFKNAEDPYFETLNMDLGDYVMCVVNTGKSHAALADEYSHIPNEMRKIAAYFNKNILSEVDEEEFFLNIKGLRNRCGDRAVLRAIHFFGDTKRVERQKDFLKAGDIEGFLKEVSESGKSSLAYLQNIYTADNYNEQGLSLALALSEKTLKNKGAWRVHGGGFAGTILTFMKKDLYKEYAEYMENVFGENACLRLNTRPYGVCRV